MSSVTSPVTVVDPGFSGVSKFASGLQQVLSRAVGIASLPLNTLQAGLTDLNNRQSALQSLDGAFLNLRQSINQLQTTAQSGLLNVSISNGSVLSATVGSTAFEGSYSVEVADPGAWSTSLSVGGAQAISDPSKEGISSSTQFDLSIGITPTPIPITAASTSLQDLTKAINTQSAGQVNATVVNVGSSSSPDYRLSLTSAKLSGDLIDLTEKAGASLISSSTPGKPASYSVDGAPAATSDTRTITLSPGLTINLLGPKNVGQPATIAVQHTSSTLLSALSSFVQSYNNAANALNSQHGQGAGVLQGDALLQGLRSVLRQLGTYTNGGANGALANFGITVDQTGLLSISTSAFTTAANGNFSDLLSVLGSSKTSGFLATATTLLSGVEDLINGSIPSAEKTVADQIAAQKAKIAEQQATLTLLQANLTAQISRADSTIASLETQVTYVTGLFATYTGATNTQNNGLQTL